MGILVNDDRDFCSNVLLHDPPQQKKQKELQKQREALKKGDKVITAGGIYGIIKEVQETTFLIEVSKDVTLKVDKGCVYVSAEDTQANQTKA